MKTMIPNLMLQFSGSAASLGSIFGAATSGLSVLGYLVYIIPAVIIIFVLYFVVLKRSPSGAKTSAGGANELILYDPIHNNIVNRDYFTVERHMDENNREIIETIARVKKSKKGIEGITAMASPFLRFFRQNQADNSDLAEEFDEYQFSSNLATFNAATRAWVAVYDFKTKTQLPFCIYAAYEDSENTRVNIDKKNPEKSEVRKIIVKTNNDQAQKYVDTTQQVEIRVTRLKTLQQGLINLKNAANPYQGLATMQFFGLVLLFVGIIALAYEISQVGPVIVHAVASSSAIIQVTNTSTP